MYFVVLGKDNLLHKKMLVFKQYMKILLGLESFAIYQNKNFKEEPFMKTFDFQLSLEEMLKLIHF